MFRSSTCYYFDDIIKLNNFDFNNILIGKISHQNILIYQISYKTLIASKPLRIRFDKTDRNFRIYDGSKYLVLSDSEKYDAIYNIIRYLIGLKINITDVFSQSYAKIKVDSFDFLSVLNKEKNHYYYKVFLEKISYQLAKK